VLDNPENVVRLLREQNLLKSVETLQVLLLNTRHKLIRVEEISDGTLDTILVHPREVFKICDCRQRRRARARAQSSERRPGAERGRHQGDARLDPRRPAFED
jgi:hypothetical protein